MVDQGDAAAHEAPLNREPAVSELVQKFLTPVSLAYDRNHGPVPETSEKDHEVKVLGLVREQISISVNELQHMPQHEVTCTLQCAGNRRHTMRKNLKEVDGIDWGDAAVMNCKWRGPRLRDILLRAGVSAEVDIETEASAPSQDFHVAFATHAQTTQDDDYYGASIPLQKALDPDASVILALEMNDAPLTPEHGAPVRVIVPGVAGARCVKWVEEVRVQDHESDCHYQQHDYKVLPPEATDAEKAEHHWDRVATLQEMPLNSVIGVPESGSKVSRGSGEGNENEKNDGCIQAVGYALPSGGSGGPIEAVEVSGDEGATWTAAELHWGRGIAPRDRRWCWCLWTARVPVAVGANRSLWSRASDRDRDQQQQWQQASAEWNLRGMAYNGYGQATDLDVFDSDQD